MVTNNEIHLYLASISLLDSQQEMEKCFLFVDEERRKKAEKIKLEQERKRSLLAGYLLKLSLGDNGAKNLVYCYKENGKPFLSGEEDLHFNLSHSGDFVLCAVAGEEVGVDIQEHRRIHPRTVDRFFSREDKEWMMETMEEDRTGRFFDLWAVKEAYIKLTGRGLSQELRSLRADFTDKKTGTVYDGVSAERGFFEILEIAEGYSQAVCTRNQKNIVVSHIRQIEG